jgi:glycosyltransferase involved in cell wall biosynthesis
MRLVIDLQDAQRAGWQRNTGQNTMALAQALARVRDHHDVLIALNAAFADTIEPIRAAFIDLLPANAIRVWSCPPLVAASDPKYIEHRQAAEILREYFLASLEPDWILLSLWCEGGNPDAIVSIGQSVELPTAVILHNSISQICHRHHPAPSDHLRRADLLLAFTKAAASNALRHLGGFNVDTVTLAAGRRARWEVSAQRVWRVLTKRSNPASRIQVSLDELTEKAIISAKSALTKAPKDLWPALAICLARNHPPKPRQPQLLIDVSQLVQHDERTGIQRVARAILFAWLQQPPEGFQVKPVYATRKTPGYRYAQHWTRAFLGQPTDGEKAPYVEAWPGDYFVGLDWCPDLVLLQQPVWSEWRCRGVRICFVLHDLLPVSLPHAFPDGASIQHARWLSASSTADQVITVSKSTADEYVAWLNTRKSKRALPLHIGWFHHGADMENSKPTTGLPPEAALVFAQLTTRPSVLMVGTLEPRKGHAQALSACDILWHQGLDFNLVVVGKPGWNIDGLIERLDRHSERNQRLLWLPGISDQYLSKVYAAATLCLMASEGEGFGLPLIEAARHGLPLLARDLGIFREVAGDHATYFLNDHKPKTLATAIAAWFDAWRSGTHRPSAGLPWLTWKQSAAQLLDVVLNGTNCRSWQGTHMGIRPCCNHNHNRSENACMDESLMTARALLPTPVQASKLTAIVHIGTEKTGSSSIQRFLHSNRIKLRAQGYYFMKSTGVMDDRKLSAFCLDEHTFDDFYRNHLIDNPEKRKAFEKQFMDDFSTELASIDQNIHTVIFSSEHLHSRITSAEGKKKLHNLLSVFFKRITICTYIRPQILLAISRYSTELKSGSTLTLNEHLLQCQTNNPYYNYETYLTSWEEVFGKAHMIVKVFNKDELFQHDVVKDFCREIGLNISEFEHPKIFNQSVQPTGQHLLRIINKKLPVFIEGIGRDTFRISLVKIISELYAGRGQMPSKETAEAIQNAFLETNEKVRIKWFPTRKTLFHIDDQSFNNADEIDHSVMVFFEKLVDGLIHEFRNKPNQTSMYKKPTKKLKSIERPFYLHIGLPKTATTTLQFEVFPQHPEIAFMGFFTKLTQKIQQPMVQDFFQNLLKEQHIESDQAQKIFHKQILPIAAKERIPLWSSERLSCLGLKQTQRFARRLRDLHHPVHIIMVVRSPFSLIESTYFQVLERLNSNKTEPMPSYLTDRFDALPRFLSIEEWLEIEWDRPARGMLGRLAVSRTAEAYSLLGAENITVLPFEALAREPAVFATRLAEAMQINADSMRTIIESSKKKNVRIPSHSFEQLQQLAVAKNANSPGDADLRLLFDKSGATHSPARANLSPFWKNRIVDEFGQQFLDLLRKHEWDPEYWGYLADVPVHDQNQTTKQPLTSPPSRTQRKQRPEPQRYKYQDEDKEIIDYDYQLLPGSDAIPHPNGEVYYRGPAPSNLTEGGYLACIGGAQTLGRFVTQPYSDQLGKTLGLETLNLGHGGGKPRYFLECPGILEHLNKAALVVVQIPSARGGETSFFKPVSIKNAVLQNKRPGYSKSPRFADKAYKEFLENESPELVAQLQSEIRENWMEEMTQLLTAIQVPKVLLWFSTRTPDTGSGFCIQTLRYEATPNFRYPHFVNRDMVENLCLLADGYVEYVGHPGIPQPLTSRFDGRPVHVFSKRKKNTDKNEYYPSPEMHTEVTIRLAETCRLLIGI